MDNKTLEHWKNYEVQKPDGTWTTVFELIQSEKKAYANDLIGAGEVVLSFKEWYGDDPHKGDFGTYKEQYLIPVIAKNKLKEKLRQKNRSTK